MSFDAGSAVVVDSVAQRPAASAGAGIDERAAAAVRRAVAGDEATGPFVLDVFAAAAALCGAVATHLVRAECALRGGTHYELRLVYAGNCVGALSTLRLAQRVAAVDWWRVDNTHVEFHVPSPAAAAAGIAAGTAATTEFVVDVWRVGAPRPVTVERIDVYARVARGDYERARLAMLLEPDAPEPTDADDDDDYDYDSDGPSVMGGGGRRPTGAAAAAAGGGAAKRRRK